MGRVCERKRVNLPPALLVVVSSPSLETHDGDMDTQHCCLWKENALGIFSFLSSFHLSIFWQFKRPSSGWEELGSLSLSRCPWPVLFFSFFFPLRCLSLGGRAGRFIGKGPGAPTQHTATFAPTRWQEPEAPPKVAFVVAPGKRTQPLLRDLFPLEHNAFPHCASPACSSPTVETFSWPLFPVSTC